MHKILVDGESLNLHQIAQRSGISKTTICRRYQEGARTYEALTKVLVEMRTPAGDIPAQVNRKTPESFKVFSEIRDRLRTQTPTNSIAVSRIREALLILNKLTVDDFR